MEITTGNATPIFTITTGMEPECYNAAMEGNIDVFQGMGEQMESILTPNENTILHIHFANYTQSVSDTFVEEVLGMCPALLLKTNVNYETILHIAARYGHHEIVRKLIDRAKTLTRDINGVGAEKRLIRAINDKKDTALHEAARYGHTEVVKVLIEEEPDHSYFGKNDGGETPLYIAVERRYWDVVDTILYNNNSPQYNGPNGRTALHAATIFGDSGKVSQLLTRNLSVAKEADENGWLPLHLAALHGNKDVVKELVSKDRSTAYMRDNKGRTALHLAALDGNVSTMDIILKYCPDCCELVDEKGCNALHYTTMDGKSYVLSKEEKEILKNAPQMKNLCNKKDVDGNTPLHYIARLAPNWETHYNHALLEPQVQGVVVDMMACNKYGQNPLDIAGADMTRDSAFENPLFGKLRAIGAMSGGRVLDKHLRGKEQEKRYDPAVDEKEKGNKTNGDARVLDKQLREKEQEKRHDPAVDEKEKGNKTNGDEQVLDKQPREKEQEKRLDLEVDEKEKRNKTNDDARVLDKQLREKEQEKRHDPAVDEKEKGNKTNGDERVLDKQLRERKQEKRRDLEVDEKEKGNKSNDEDLLSGLTNYLSVVATLIATVTFTAGFTLPGGLNQDKGSPILKYNAAFKAFVITDSLSFVLSTCVVLLIFYAISANKVQREMFEDAYKRLVFVCMTLTSVALNLMIVAFGTGLYAVLGVSSKGLGVVTLSIVVSLFYICPVVTNLSMLIYISFL